MIRLRKIVLPITILLTATLACGRGITTPSAYQPGDIFQTTTVGGLERTYLIHVPDNLNSDQAVPLVFVFHGYTGNAGQARLISGFNGFADDNEFIVVYPNGTGYDESTLSWNGGRCCAYASDTNVDDVGFVRQMLIKMKAIYRIDLKRVYATGMSNGGIFTYRLACEMSDVFAAVAPVAGSFIFEPCQPSEPVSVLHIHGLDDHTVPYDGRNPPPELSGIDFTPVEEGIAFWAQQDGCPSKPRITQDGDVTHTIYASCQKGTAVELFGIAGVGHTWPLLKLPASRVIWDFFAAHPKK